MHSSATNTAFDILNKPYSTFLFGKRKYSQEIQKKKKIFFLLGNKHFLCKFCTKFKNKQEKRFIFFFFAIQQPINIWCEFQQKIKLFLVNGKKEIVIIN